MCPSMSLLKILLLLSIQYIAFAIEEIVTLQANGTEVVSASLSSDGTMIVSVSGKQLLLWNVSSGVCMGELFTASANFITALFVSDTSSGFLRPNIVSTDYNRKVWVWDIPLGDVSWEFWEKTYVWTFMFFPNRQRIAYGCANGRINLWNPQEATQPRWFLGHTADVLVLAASSDETKLASGSLDSKVMIWDVETRSLLHTLIGHTAAIRALAFSSTGEWVISGDEGGLLCFWNTSSGTLMRAVSLVEKQTKLMAFSPGGQYIAYPAANFNIYICDTRTGALSYLLQGHVGDILSLSFSADGQKLLSSSADGSIKLWHAKLSDCHVSEWSTWGPCGMNQSRSRTVLVHPANGGIGCPPLLEFRACLSGQFLMAIILGPVSGFIALVLLIYLYLWRKNRLASRRLAKSAHPEAAATEKDAVWQPKTFQHPTSAVAVTVIGSAHHKVFTEPLPSGVPHATAMANVGKEPSDTLAHGQHHQGQRITMFPNLNSSALGKRHAACRFPNFGPDDCMNDRSEVSSCNLSYLNKGTSHCCPKGNHSSLCLVTDDQVEESFDLSGCDLLPVKAIVLDAECFRAPGGTSFSRLNSSVLDCVMGEESPRRLMQASSFRCPATRLRPNSVCPEVVEAALSNAAELQSVAQFDRSCRHPAIGAAVSSFGT